MSCLIFLALSQAAAGIVSVIPFGVWAIQHLQELKDALQSTDPGAALQQLMSRNGDLLMVGTALAAAPTVGVVVLCRRVIDKQPWAALGLAFNGRHLAFGFAAGAVAVLGIFAVLVVTGEVRVLGFTADPPVVRVAGLLGMVFLQSGAEELVCRGYLLRTLMGRYRTTTSVALVSLFFGALHLMNPDTSALSFVGTVAVGVLFALVCLRTGGLWWAIGLHTAWNFTLGSIVSLPVSGVSLSHLLDVESVGSPWLTGGTYGLEASTLTLALIAVCSASLAVSVVHRGRTSR